MNAATKIEAATLASAMAAAFSEIEGATKATQGQVGQQKYKYADLTSVIDAIKPALINHSLFFTQHPEPSDKGVCIETVLHHAGGESLSLGKLFVPANKQDAQGYGSALTYARRYALVTAFGVPVEDDDGNAASKAATAGSARGQNGGHAASPAEPADLITASDLTLAITLCDALGGNQAQTICEAYRVSSLTELTAKQGAAVVTRLNEQHEATYEPADLITASDLTLAITLCDALGGNQAQTICEAYRVSALTELTAKQGAAVVTRLNEKLQAKKETANV